MARKILKTLSCIALLLSTATFSVAADAEDPKQNGPVALVIQYRCLPGQRATFRQQLLSIGLPSFAQWQADGILADYHLLFSRYVDTNSWDALALVTFRHYSDVTRWRKVEAERPAGLPENTLALTTSVETYPVDLLRQGASSDRPLHPVYMVVPYTFSVTTPAYLKYFDDYVGPQFKGWIDAGVLGSYQVYLQRYTAARPWDVMIFLQYKDDDSFGLREKTVAETRAKLQSNPVWKAASDNKQSLRVEKQAIIADELTLH